MFRKTSRAARDRTDRILAGHGVRVGQQFVLEALWREGGLTSGELARRIRVETPTVVRGVGRTEAAGLIVRDALVTTDLDATIRFYGEVVGATERRGRHCFIKPGDDSETWGLHLFEQHGAEVFAYPDTFERYALVPGTLQHVAFALPDEVATLALRRRLATFGVDITGITDLGPVSNMLLRDNNGLLLEATWARS